MSSNISISIDVESHVTSRADPDDEWDRDNTSSSHRVIGGSLVSDASYSDVVVSEDYQAGTVVFVVHAQWSTGDSFGHDAGGAHEVIDVFTDIALAQACADSLENTPVLETGDWSKCHKSWTAGYVRQDGTPTGYHRPWIGYFESLDWIQITPVILTDLRKSS